MTTQRTVLVIADSGEDDTSYHQQLQQDRSMDYTILSGLRGMPLAALTQSPLALDGILLEFGVLHTRGLHLLQQLKEQINAPVVVIGGGETEVAVQALKIGAVDYLIKDRTAPDDLRLAMRTAIKNAELKRELQRSQETFLTSVENMLDCFGIFSAMRDDVGQIVDFRIDYLNAAACENDQMSKEMQIGRGLCDVLPAHRESGLFDEYCQVVETGEPLVKDSLIYDDTYESRRLIRAFDIRATKLNDGFVASWRDVTDRKRLELELNQTVEALQATQQHNRDLAEAMPHMVWAADSTGAVNYWNQAWYEYTGLNEAESLGIAGVSTVHPEERDRVVTQWNDAVDQGQSFEIEYRIRNRQGDYRWFICRATPTRDRQHQITGWIGTITDIDEQKQTTLALEKSQERLELAMEAASMGSWDWNIQTGEVRWSPSLEHLFGMAPGEFDGRYETVQAMIHPEDLPKFERAIQCALDEGEEYNFEFRFIKPDGAVRWALSLGRVFYDNDGNPVMMTGVDRDITSWKRVQIALHSSERRYRSLVEAVAQIIWHTNEQAEFVTEQPSWTAFTGQTFDELKGQGWLNAVHPDDREKITQACAKALENQTPCEGEYRLQRQDGAYRRMQVRAVPVLDETGTLLEWVGVHTDVTDAKQAELQLQESEERLQLGMQVAGFALIQIDYTTNTAHLSPQAAALYGLPCDQLTITREQLHATFHPEDRPQLERHIEEILNPIGTGGFAQDHRVLLNDGKVKWLTVRKQVFFDHSSSPPQPDHAILAALDITDLKQTEQALRENVSRFRTLADNISQLAWMANEVGWIFWYNQRWFDYTGTTPEAMQGWGWQAVHHPDYVERVVEKISQCFATGEIWEDTFPLQGQDGEYRWFLSRAVPIRDEQGRVLRWFGTHTDITELREAENALRQSEERYRCLVESIPQLVWTADDAGQLLDVNQRWIEFTGLSLEQARTAGWEAVVHPEDVPNLIQQWTEAAQRGTSYQAEGRMRQADGTYRWFLHQAIPQRHEQGHIIKWFGSATDIDGQKQLELDRDRLLQQEQAAREAAERANRIKDEFLAVLSHELRSPLNPILGWARLLQTRQFDAERTAIALATIERNAKLQTQLIDDLLDIAKILRGKLVMEMTPIDLVSVIKSAIGTMSDAAAAKSIQLRSVLPRVGLISGDAVRLQQIVWNLLSNAIKFTPNGGSVEVRLEQVSGIGSQVSGAEEQVQAEASPQNPIPKTPNPNTQYAQISVTDTGKGISPDFLPHLFESFRQEDASTTREFGGLGLGLAIVRTLVEAHRGMIRADSPGIGQGATFTVQLPLIESEPEGQPREPAPVQDLNLAGVRVLTVDDEPDARELVATVLEIYGAEVLTAASAAEALNALQSFRPDVIVSDIGMPNVDGHRLIQQIRALPPEKSGQIPAIALTAYAREEDYQRATTSGFQQQVTKPLEPEQLVQAVVAVVRGG